jgi:hypothetical protein
LSVNVRLHHLKHTLCNNEQPVLLDNRGHPPSVLPHTAYLRHSQPQAYRPRTYVRASYRTLPAAVSTLRHYSDVLVIPRRVVPRLRDLDTTELAALMSSVQHVGRVIERVYGADALTVACQVRLQRRFALVCINHVSRTAKPRDRLFLTYTFTSYPASNTGTVSRRGTTKYTLHWNVRKATFPLSWLQSPLTGHQNILRGPKKMGWWGIWSRSAWTQTRTGSLGLWKR